MRRKTWIFIASFIMIVCILFITTISVFAAYYAKGKFKDVFANKQEYFASDILQRINSIDGAKIEIGSGGKSRDIRVFNHNIQSGDYNAFDLVFDIYAWVDSDLNGETYTLTYKKNGETKTASVSEMTHTFPVVKGLMLKGGNRSTNTITVSFPYENEIPEDAPGLHIVVKPTSPSRMATDSFVLGAVINPTESDDFSVGGNFEKKGRVGDNAAFVYRVRTNGNAPEGGKIVLQWDSTKLELKSVNKEAPQSSSITYEADGICKLELEAQSNHTDTIIFFRNANKAEEGDPPTGSWDSSLDDKGSSDEEDEQKWSDLEALVSVEYKNNSQE